VIASLSLGSACAMQLRQVGGDGRLDLVLPPRSLVVMRGPAWHGWTHAIPARKSDVIDGRRIPRGRSVSLTFRTMRLDG
jgi:alkylated DNA repair dioxygenase AlkB